MIFLLCFEKTGSVLQKREKSCKKWNFVLQRNIFGWQVCFLAVYSAGPYGEAGGGGGEAGGASASPLLSHQTTYAVQYSSSLTSYAHNYMLLKLNY